VIGHEINTIDWTQAHEWALLVLVLLGVFTLWRIFFRVGMWAVSATGRRLQARRERRAPAVSDDDLRQALVRIAAVLEELQGGGRR